MSSDSLLVYSWVSPSSVSAASSTPPCGSLGLSRLMTSYPRLGGKILLVYIDSLSHVSVPMRMSGFVESSSTCSSLVLFLNIYTLEVYNKCS